MEITYTQQGDYLLPNLTLPEQDKRPIGLWGQQHLRYIKRCCPILYTNMLTKCKLNEYLADIDEQAQKIYNELVQSFAKEEGCTEQLKATNQMLWVRKTNNAVQRAREVVNAEIIYS
nr:MAG TPA: transposon-encoded protein [Caudoviricetes sp.]